MREQCSQRFPRYVLERKLIYIIQRCNSADTWSYKEYWEYLLKADIYL